MATVLFCPVTFNLAETTRMVQVGRAMSPAHRVLFVGYEDDYVGLIRDAGFEYTACAPAFTADDPALHGHPRPDQLLGEGAAERPPLIERDQPLALTRDTGTGSVVTGSNLTSFISARAELGGLAARHPTMINTAPTMINKARV